MKENQKDYKLCDICKSQAKYICLECLSNYYCDSCYKWIHNKKENSNHKKEQIDYLVPIEARCQEHQNIPFNLFCLDDKGNFLI